MADALDVEIPAGRRHIIERPRLTRLLDATPARVIMLIAPAGYGKTTLARQWLAARPHVWYPASAASGDVAALALGIAEASASLASDMGLRLREWLPTSRKPEREVRIIAELLMDDISHWPKDSWLGIDDYHLLATEAAQELVHRLLDEKTIKLLITSRSRPRWATARGLLYGDFYELGASSLALSTREARLVLSNIEAKTGDGLVAHANGWPAVIGLAALSRAPLFRNGDDLPEALHDYFAEELYDSLEPSTTKQRDSVSSCRAIQTRSSSIHFCGHFCFASLTTWCREM
jgi:LuxR family maltose regulon positive regulatory protein